MKHGEMGVHRLEVYRSPNIGIFLKTNDDFVLVPSGLALTKTANLSRLLGVHPVRASIAGSRLLGPLAAMNGRGILVSRMAEDEELAHIKASTGLPVERLPSRFTSVGNLVAANDKGAIASSILCHSAVQKVRDVLDVPVEVLNVASYLQVGSMVAATNLGGVFHPKASKDEAEKLGGILDVELEPATVNAGVPFVASGLVANSKAALVGSLTSGPELMILSRALGL